MKEGLFPLLALVFPALQRSQFSFFMDGEWSKKFHKPSLLDFWSNPSVCLLVEGEHYEKLNKKLISR